METLKWLFDTYGNYLILLWPSWSAIKKVKKKINQVQVEEDTSQVPSRKQTSELPETTRRVRQTDREIPRLLAGVVVLSTLALYLATMLIWWPVLTGASFMLRTVVGGLALIMTLTVIGTTLFLPAYNSFMDWKDEYRNVLEDLKQQKELRESHPEAVHLEPDQRSLFGDELTQTYEQQQTVKRRANKRSTPPARVRTEGAYAGSNVVSNDQRKGRSK